MAKKIKGGTINRLKKLQVEHKQYNKEMRQIGCHKLQKTFDDFLDYKYNRYKTKRVFVAPPEPEYYRKPEKYVPSLNSGVYNQCSKQQEKQYTGELISGVATMHKSNAVPVMNNDQAKDLASMRRQF